MQVCLADRLTCSFTFSQTLDWLEAAVTWGYFFLRLDYQVRLGSKLKLGLGVGPKSCSPLGSVPLGTWDQEAWPSLLAVPGHRPFSVVLPQTNIRGG